MSVARVREAYAARAAEYISLFGSIEAAAEQDREYVLAWARAVNGRIIDVGCGPGQWTDYLHGHGVDIEGVDPVPAFIDEARQRYPGVEYRAGHADRLGVDDASLGGVLAWYSLIHTEPDQIGVPLAELARCIRPGGGLTIGFVEGAELAPFDHAVTTAYFWPVGLLSSRVERAGFVVADVHTRADPGARPQGAIIARRTGRGPRAS
jgi:ubiquinone/menaquinone biosynthesis C-methylase UbiE